AFARDGAGVAPGTTVLPTPASFAQDHPDRKGADMRQAIFGTPQGLTQSTERPTRRAILFAIGEPLRFGENPLPLGQPIAGGWSAGVTGLDSRQSFAIEACHQVRDSLTRLAPGGMGGCLIRQTRCHGQEDLGPRDMTGWFALGATDLGQESALFIGERPKRVFLAARHSLAPEHTMPITCQPVYLIWTQSRCACQ